MIYSRLVLRLAAAVVALLTVEPPAANADLVSVDLKGTGDGLVTRDTATSLEWLDLPATKGFSVNEILAGGGAPFGDPSWIDLGFRFASLSELCGLFTPRTGPIIGCGGQAGSVPDAAVIELQTYLGITSEEQTGPGAQRATEGYYESGFAGMSRFIDGSGAVAIANSNFDPDAKVPSSGNWLVRVPEPASLLLASISIGAMILLRRPSA